MTPVLKATGISVRFGGVRAVVDVDLEVGEGRLVGLIGPNGAGKTTFIDAISGFVRCDGRVELDGEDLTGASPHVRARRGLARTWQSIELFDDLSVGENVLVASHRTSAWRTIRETVSVPDSHPAEITHEFRDGGWTADAIADAVAGFTWEPYGVRLPELALS